MWRCVWAGLWCAAGLVAQDYWENVKRLRPGEPITVVRRDGHRINGDFVSASDGSLAVRMGGKQTGVDRGDVLRVSSRGSSKRWRNTLIGAGAGVVVGAVINGTLGSYLRNEGQPEALHSLIWILPIGFGAGMGAAIPGYPTVYRAR